MKHFKKFIIWSILLSITCILNSFCFADDGLSLWTDFPYEIWDDVGWEVNIDISDMLKTEINKDENWLKRLLILFMPNDSMYGSSTSPSFLFYLKTVVNLLLSFVSLIALILTIYAFYMMFFKKDEAGRTTAKQMMKWIVIALAVIWFSWIIVSFLYRLEEENTQNLWYNNNTEITTSLT